MWSLTKNQLPGAELGVEESLFTLGNGYLGVRGFFEEWKSEHPDSIRGAYINGVYDRVPMAFGERAVGFPEEADKQPRLPDAQCLEIYLDEELLDLDSVEILSFERHLDFKNGCLYKKYSVVTSSGKTAHLTAKKMIAFEEKHLCLSHWQVQYPGRVKMVLGIEGDVKNYENPEDPRVAQGHSRLLSLVEKAVDLESEIPLLYLKTKTQNSHIDVGMGLGIVTKETINITDCSTDSGVFVNLESSQGLELSIYQYVSDSRQEDICQENVFTGISTCAEKPHQWWFESQRSHLEKFWEVSDIEIYGDEETQLEIRFALFQLYQSVGKDSISNLSAKGLSGEGYEGHYFWDTEMYALPLFSLSQPNIARALLEFRFKQMPQAREEARKMGHDKGVKFPWRTISGIESSGYFPAGTAQYHINADIAYGVIQYMHLTKDQDFLSKIGLPLLVETSRFFIGVGQWIGSAFHINCVTGPDEYTALVDNNFYTNAMVKHQLEWTAKLARQVMVTDPERWKVIREALYLSEAELDNFERAASAMRLPRNSVYGIDLQDDQCLSRAPWPFETVPKTHYPLLLHYHPLIIYRHQVLKQADTVLAHLMLPTISEPAVMARSFEFYEALTTHDSSLSSCIYGAMAARLGFSEKAWQYFRESVDIDLKNTHGNTKDGLHMANLAGSCLSIIRGFAGLDVTENGLSISPMIPAELEGYSFSCLWEGKSVKIKVIRELGEVKTAIDDGGHGVPILFK